MNGRFTLSRGAFFKLVDALTIPNPDDPGDPNNPFGPYGPIGPVIRQSIASALSEIDWVLLNPQPLPPRVARAIQELRRELDWVLLNPQPLPPKEGPHPDPWRMGVTRFGPQPDPWRIAAVTRGVIAQMLSQFRQAELIAGRENSERTLETFRSQLSEFVDDWCGTRPGRWPWPPRPRRDELDPAELIVAGAQFARIAEALQESPLQSAFSAAADRFLETALQRMEGDVEVGYESTQAE